MVAFVGKTCLVATRSTLEFTYVIVSDILLQFQSFVKSYNIFIKQKIGYMQIHDLFKYKHI